MPRIERSFRSMVEYRRHYYGSADVKTPGSSRSRAIADRTLDRFRSVLRREQQPKPNAQPDWPSSVPKPIVLGREEDGQHRGSSV